ncbi:hypothetical protein KP509_05G079200 [Ceratopteris richardii]|uniref:Heterokaryon incompatibility domain-containing protein n=1 Tax=Ceratopteris richardii TaxID=49495 RepID=A0A8T2UUJ7_CERRI|nr:hypothetical protein KP509_05G079200 [Ceratopteris richardii]
MWPFELLPQISYHVILRAQYCGDHSSLTEGCSPHIQLLTDNLRAPTQANQQNWVMGCIGWFTSCSSGTHPLFLRTEIGSKLDRNGYWYLDAVILLPELVQSYGSVSHVDSTPDALFFHVNSAHWTGQPFSNISTDTRPKRLINISKTLLTRGGVFFSEAESWDFHVISHTWSADLRNFSKEIAQKIGVGDDCSYESLFRKTDFSKEPAYQSLMNLLRILQSDGVEDVWLDALCINQEDNDEKSHEIAHMGAFYMHSKGCYVNTHGIGKGYKLAVKNKDGGYSIARWFTRAWTLQEYILPPTLTFLVGSLPERLKHLVNHMVCKCNFSEMEKILAHTLSLAIESFAFMDPRAKINEIIGSDEVVPCCKCAKLPFIRKANLARSGNQSELFFIERLFYGFLLRCFHFCIVRQEDNNHMQLTHAERS